MQTLKVCKLSGRKQQFPEFIAMISAIRPPVGKWESGAKSWLVDKKIPTARVGIHHLEAT
ncbi:Uncharacterised protein [Buttiauxella agrestis]|uniref:Uncharacterized protein n=1 Tax=Buttiauxella agrestis TaxID=82977 RepID=A0A381C3M3_9ENTR|nr:hypothetical protein [Buttiauxella agrestis]SUW62490.1 Uncharacterised protein [Buttiauxella agrestis]